MLETKPSTIDLAKARELLAAAVETQGRDFVYKPAGYAGVCDYFPHKHASPTDDPRAKTGCLIGVALKLHGIDVTRLGGSVSLLYAEHQDMMTEEAAQYFTPAQEHQDAGGTWGEAFDYAEGLANEGRLDEVVLEGV